MNRCQDIRSRMTLYLDEELQGNERADFENHLRNCEQCATLLKSEQKFLDVIREVKPLYEASPELRDRVQNLLGTSAPAPTAPEQLRRRIRRSLEQVTHTGPRDLSVRAIVVG